MRMVRIESVGDEFWVSDVEQNELRIAVSDWQDGVISHSIDRRVDERMDGTVRELVLPEGSLCIESDSREGWTEILEDLGPIELPAENHLLQIEAAITIFLRFRSEATVERVEWGGRVRIVFPKPTPVTIGFRSHVSRPRHELQVPPTPAGVAQAITYSSAALETLSPDRSYPSLRHHPPELSLGECQTIPDEIVDLTPDPDITLTLPRTLAAVFVAAPLAYYLGATVTVHTNATPRLEAPQVGIDREFPSLPELQHRLADLLYRVFMLDCLVRTVGKYGIGLAESDLLSELEIDPDRAYELSPPARLREYLSVDFDAIAENLPEWHLSTYVDPVSDSIPTIPHLLDRMSMLYLADSDPLDREEMVRRSLDEYFRAPSGPESPVSSIEPVIPQLHRGRYHAWLAEEVPIDVFKVVPEAFDNRFKYFDRPHDKRSVVVVANDPEMEFERTTVTEIYRERAKELSIDVDIHQEIPKAELRDILKEVSDFVHFIGHCTDQGLQCSNGYLSVADLDRVRARTFFLNACGSYHEGLALVRNGSVAGGVTMNRILNIDAVKTGRLFAKLVMQGYPVAASLDLAGSRTPINKHYLTVGDGTYTISQNIDTVPSLHTIEQTDHDRYSITTRKITASRIGGIAKPMLSPNPDRYLEGSEVTKIVDTASLRKFLDSSASLVRFDGEYYWSDEMLAHL